MGNIFLIKFLTLYAYNKYGKSDDQWDDDVHHCLYKQEQLILAKISYNNNQLWQISGNNIDL